MGKRVFEQYTFDDCSNLIVGILSRLAILRNTDKDKTLSVELSIACIDTHLDSLNIPVSKPPGATLTNILYTLHETLKRWSEKDDAWYNPEYKVLWNVVYYHLLDISTVMQ